MPKMIGTILPTKASIAATHAHSIALKAMKEHKAQSLVGDHVVVAGESRYYDTPSTYAIVSSSGKIRRFRVVNGEDFAV